MLGGFFSAYPLGVTARKAQAAWRRRFSPFPFAPQVARGGQGLPESTSSPTPPVPRNAPEPGVRSRLAGESELLQARPGRWEVVYIGLGALKPSSICARTILKPSRGRARTPILVQVAIDGRSRISSGRSSVGFAGQIAGAERRRDSDRDCGPPRPSGPWPTWPCLRSVACTSMRTHTRTCMCG